MKAKRRLKNIDIEEVSLVGTASNKQKFLFWKKEGSTGIEISTDGSAEGTIIKVNGEELEDLNSFYFSLYGGSDPTVSCSFSRNVETEDGFKRVESYNLSKGGIVMDEIKTLVKTLFGEDVKFDKQGKVEEKCKIVKEALDVIKEYKEDMPEDLEKAVKGLFEVVLSNLSLEKEAEAEKDNKDKTLKKDETNTNNVNKDNKNTDDLNKLVKSIEEMTKVVKDNGETLKKVSDRVDELEKQSTDSKVIEGNDSNKNTKETDNFPSFAL